MSDYKDDEIDVEPYEGEPEFKSSQALNDEGHQDDKENADA
jgi:hypothetical protein